MNSEETRLLVSATTTYATFTNLRSFHSFCFPLSVFGSSVPPRSYVRRAWDMPTDRGTMWLLMDVTAGAD